MGNDYVGGLYWPWWIAIGLAIMAAITVGAVCLIKLYGGKRKRIDVEDKETLGDNSVI